MGIPVQQVKKDLQKFRRDRQRGTGSGLSRKGAATPGGGLALMAPPQPVKRFTR